MGVPDSTPVRGARLNPAGRAVEVKVGAGVPGCRIAWCCIDGAEFTGPFVVIAE